MKKNIFLFLLLALMIFGCAQKTETAAENELASVTTTKAELKMYQPERHFSGALTAHKEANLGPVLPGRVEKIYFQEGDKVKKGDLLVEMSGELLTQAQIEYETYKKDFERMSRLREKNAVSEMDYDHMKAQYEAKLENYKLVKKNTEICATFDGTVVDHLLEEGETFLFLPKFDVGYSHSIGVITLMQLDPMIIKIEANQQDLNSITLGQNARITIDAFPNEEFTAKISQIKPVLSNLSHTAEIELTLPNHQDQFKPGMYCHVYLQYPQSEQIYIPRSCLLHQTGTGEYYVYVVKNSVATRTDVNILADLSAHYIVDNLAAGAEVILSGQNKVNNGTKVSVVSED